MSSLDSTLRIIQLILIVPIALFIWSILLLLSIFRTKPLDQAFSVTKYKELKNKTFEEVLLYEINANTHSYGLNVIFTEKGNKRYANGIRLITIALIFSIVLMLASKFMDIEKKPTRVKVVAEMLYNSEKELYSSEQN